MTDTAQPATAAETEVVSREDQLASAAESFKAFTAGEPINPPRDDKGRFAPQAQEGAEEIEAEAEGEEPEDAAESQDNGQDDDQTAEEAQSSEVDMPHSWPAEQAEQWKALPPETQALIAEREGQRDAAVNAKFQEAANVRKAHEAEIIEARSTRQQAIQAADLALSLVRPTEPPLSMLDINSSDYDPDSYHLAKAQYDRSFQYLSGIAAQRQQLVAQAQQEQAAQEAQYIQQINNATAPAFLKEVPDAADPRKLPGLINDLCGYLVQHGAPADMFDGSETALQWHIVWKAREFDKLQAAKGKVQTGQKPEPRKASPAVRPGVATPPSAQKAARRQGAKDRLARSGTIEDGAAVWKQFL